MLKKIILLAIIVVQLNAQERDSYPMDSQACENGGICVPKYLCRANNTINTDGQGIIDVRAGAEQPTCKDDQHTCCGAPNYLGCGYRNVKGVGESHITSAADGQSEFGEFPWMVMILEETIKNGQNITYFRCGGSLIHPSVVLTAAHCVERKIVSNLLIRAGEWDTQTKNEFYAHEDRFVQSVKIHATYSRLSLYDDVALLFLAGAPLELAPNINTVCLPPQNNDFDSQNCFVSGWGKDIFGEEGHYQTTMKKVELPIVPQEKCLEQLRNTRLRQRFFLDGSFICAGGEKGKDACTGDGGGPLVCPIDSGSQARYFQTGLVAWGIGCGTENVPGVYVKVSLFRNWIDREFDIKRLDKKFYIA